MKTIKKLEVNKSWEPELGQVVFLNSGSPPLTVAAIYGDEDIFVQVFWMDGASKERCDLPLECIREDMPIFGDHR
jgi:hypothetical protein